MQPVYHMCVCLSFDFFNYEANESNTSNDDGNMNTEKRIDLSCNSVANYKFEKSQQQSLAMHANDTRSNEINIKIYTSYVTHTNGKKMCCLSNEKAH